ncbi:MAG: hypothetical protein M1503_01390 [Thaumarchaeota archaeon]|nr:hypothetical protein [Nitrososphaerota archaeon]MCL5316909.1 hypothetical protein [Nitrososphaerota archaeon]
MNHLKTQVTVSSLLILMLFQLIPAFAQAQVKTENYISMDNPPSGLIWTGKLFIFPSAEDNITKLYAVDPHDRSINRFGATFAAKGDNTHIAASSGVYFPAGYIYATSGDQIHEISADGNTVRVFTTPANGVDVVGLAFDNRAYWNDKLAAVTKDGVVWVIDRNGDREKVADLGANSAPTAVTVARDEFGDFSGDILVTTADGKVLAVSHTTHNVRTVTQIAEGTPKQILYAQTLSDLYVAEQKTGAIVKIDRDLVKDHLAEIMVVSEAKDKTLTLTAIKSDRAGVKTATITTGLGSDIKGVGFVLDSELADAIKGPEPKGVEIDPLLIIIPIFAIVVVVTAIIIWRYRGF